MEFAKRIAGAMRMDPATYEAVEADPTALRQALIVVLGFGLAAGIGLAGNEPTAGSLVGGTLWALASWIAWAAIVYQIGVRVMPERQTQADPAEIARTIGFSAAPGLLLPAAAIPGMPSALFAVILLWMLAAMVVAVREALDFRRLSRAFGVCLLGWAIVALVLVLMGAFGPVLR